LRAFKAKSLKQLEKFGSDRREASRLENVCAYYDVEE
jgi:hypothetical protein